MTGDGLRHRFPALMFARFLSAHKMQFLRAREYALDLFGKTLEQLTSAEADRVHALTKRHSPAKFRVGCEGRSCGRSLPPRLQ